MSAIAFLMLIVLSALLTVVLMSIGVAAGYTINIGIVFIVSLLIVTLLAMKVF